VKYHYNMSEDTGTLAIQWYLSREAWLNVKADSLAKNKINPAHIPVGYALIPFEPAWHILIGKQKIVKNHKRALQLAFNRPKAEKYWLTKLQNLNSSATLDTQAMDRAMSESTSARRRWATKQLTNQFTHG